MKRMAPSIGGVHLLDNFEGKTQQTSHGLGLPGDVRVHQNEHSIKVNRAFSPGLMQNFLLDSIEVHTMSLGGREAAEGARSRS